MKLLKLKLFYFNLDLKELNLTLFLSVLKMSEKPLAALDFDFKIC